MNLSEIIIGFFRRRNHEQEAAAAAQLGDQHAEIVATAYADAFVNRLSSILHERQQRFIGHDDAIDAEFEPVDYESKTRPELQRLARERQISYPPTAKKADLIALLSD